MGKYHKLDAVVKEKGKICGYILYNFFAGYYEYWTLEDVIKRIDSIEDGFIDSRGYLRVKGKNISDYPIKTIKDLNNYDNLI